jgi:hypothetical protein
LLRRGRSVESVESPKVCDIATNNPPRGVEQKPNMPVIPPPTPTSLAHVFQK